MIKWTLDSFPIPAPQARGRLLENEAVVVLPERGEVKVLNDVGTHIWTLADGTRTVRDIVSALCAEYEVTPAVAEADTLAFLAVLHEKGLITIRA